MPNTVHKANLTHFMYFTVSDFTMEALAIKETKWKLKPIT